MARDKDYIAMIGSARWAMLRRVVLSSHPLCERCQAEGYITAATEVHHIVPVETALRWRDKERLMFSPGNLRPLCHRCHVKTHTELGRSGKEANIQRVKEHVESINKRFYGDDAPGDDTAR